MLNKFWTAVLTAVVETLVVLLHITTGSTHEILIIAIAFLGSLGVYAVPNYGSTTTTTPPNTTVR